MDLRNRPKTCNPALSSSAPLLKGKRPMTVKDVRPKSKGLASGSTNRIQSSKETQRQGEGSMSAHAMQASLKIPRIMSSTVTSTHQHSHSGSLSGKSKVDASNQKKLFFQVGNIKGNINQFDDENRALLTKISVLSVCSCEPGREDQTAQGQDLHRRSQGRQNTASRVSGGISLLKRCPRLSP